MLEQVGDPLHYQVLDRALCPAGLLYESYTNYVWASTHRPSQYIDLLAESAAVLHALCRWRPSRDMSLDKTVSFVSFSRLSHIRIDA